MYVESNSTICLQSRHDISMWVEIIAGICLAWYVFIAIVCLIGYVQLYGLFLDLQIWFAKLNKLQIEALFSRPRQACLFQFNHF